MNKLIKDYKLYLDEIYRLSKPLSKEQKDALYSILQSQLVLLIALKKDSNLGRFNFYNKYL